MLESLEQATGIMDRYSVPSIPSSEWYSMGLDSKFSSLCNYYTRPGAENMPEDLMNAMSYVSINGELLESNVKSWDNYLLEHPAEQMKEGTVLDKAKQFVLDAKDVASKTFDKFKTSGFASYVAASGKMVVDWVQERLDSEGHQSYKDKGMTFADVANDFQQTQIAAFEDKYPGTFTESPQEDTQSQLV